METESKVPNCNRCFALGKISPAVGFIPIATPEAKIFVCDVHFVEAQDKCFYVLRLDQSPEGWDYGFDRRTWEKHVQLRGSRELKYK